MPAEGVLSRLAALGCVMPCGIQVHHDQLGDYQLCTGHTKQI